MLLKKSKPKAGDYVALKLVSGDEIITKIKEINNDEISVSKPIAVIMAPNGAMAFVPFMFGADEESDLIFKTNQVVAMAHAREEFKNAYIENTSGITPAGGLTDGLTKG